MSLRLIALTLNGMAGGAEYAKLVLLGEYAPKATIRERRAICKACPSRRRERALGALKESDWCGPNLDPQEGPPPTCGCLLWGKTLVASAKCPQDKWRSVPARSRRKPRHASHQNT